MENLENFERLINYCEIIPYPKPYYEDMSQSQKAPVAFALTEFHALLAYGDMIKGVSILNSELVFEDSYNESLGKLINVVKDPIKGKYYHVN